MFDVFRTAWKNRLLLWRLTRREIKTRYQGSALGFAWALLLPLATIGIYTFVFSTIFQARWHQPSETSGNYSFAMLLFAGFLTYGIFAESVNRSTGLMSENVSYIKKVVFPLEILPWVTVCVAVINAALGYVVLLLMFVMLYGIPSATILLLPLALLPVSLFALGTTFLLASLGVFLRDLRQVVPLLTTALLFLSPVFYPLDTVPSGLRPLILANPLTLAILDVRAVLFEKRVPDPTAWAAYMVCATVVAVIGYAWFSRTKKAFADVI